MGLIQRIFSTRMILIDKDEKLGEWYVLQMSRDELNTIRWALQDSHNLMMRCGSYSSAQKPDILYWEIVRHVFYTQKDNENAKTYT